MGIYQLSTTTSNNGALSFTLGGASGGTRMPLGMSNLDVQKEYEDAIREGLESNNMFGVRRDRIFKPGEDQTAMWLQERDRELDHRETDEAMEALLENERDQNLRQMGRKKPMPYVGPRGVKYSDGI